MPRVGAGDVGGGEPNLTCESVSDTSSARKLELTELRRDRYSCEHKVSDEKPLKLPLYRLLMEQTEMT